MANRTVLRPYQEAAIRSMREAYVAGHRRILLVSPTGSGKTVMLAGGIAAGSVAKGKRVAWFAHRRELREQAADTLAGLGLDVSEGKRPEAPVQVVSTQASVIREFVPPADVVVIDEAHHYAADEWKAIPDAYLEQAKATGREILIVGATATPERGDGRPLNHLFEHLILVAQTRELVELGHLVPCEVERPDKYQRKGKIAQLPVDVYLGERMSVGARMGPCVVFASHVAEAEVFAEQFRTNGVKCAVVHGKLVRGERDGILADFRAGRIPVVINVYVLTEGWDCPEVSMIIMARRCGSQTMLLQCVGRGMRPAPGKKVCRLFDLVGVTIPLGHPMDDRVFSLDGERGITSATRMSDRYCKVCGAPIPEGESSCPDCGTNRELLIGTASGAKLSRFDKIRTDTADERVRRLAKWMREEIARGNKWQRALYRYKGAYGCQATGAEVKAALAAQS